MSGQARPFIKIFDTRRGYTEADQPAAEHALNETAESVEWNVLHPGQAVVLEDSGKAIVISQVTWSKPDFDFLDEPAARDTSGWRVWFFNLDKVFPDEQILPGAGPVVATPAFAECSGRRLVAFLQGGGYSGGAFDHIRKLFPIRPPAL